MTTKNIEELMIDAEAAIEPGSDETDIDMGHGDLRGTLSIESAGWVKVWDMRTGEESKVLGHPDYLRRQLQKLDPGTGKRIFTTVKPSFKPFRGSALCPLHRDAPEFSEYQKRGYPVCRKSNLRNDAEAERHLRIKHSDTFLMMERTRQREIEEEERAVRQATIQAFNGKPVAAQPTVPASDWTGACEVCGRVLTAKNKGGLGSKLRSHKIQHG